MSVHESFADLQGNYRYIQFPDKHPQVYPTMNFHVSCRPSTLSLTGAGSSYLNRDSSTPTIVPMKDC